MILPKLYDGHNRTFFMFSWESYRSLTGDNRLGIVPTGLERQGDFSQSRDATGKLIPVKDPLAGNAALPGNQIPPARLNQVVTGTLLPIYPLPNNAGVNNYRVDANPGQPGVPVGGVQRSESHSSEAAHNHGEHGQRVHDYEREYGAHDATGVALSVLSIRPRGATRSPN